ncbi:hypothetical protein GQX73_g4862 [Xylaria multiplex]|uniref:Uncharacterized protein n=1 Tax=Xylaria multiplex TaxID=323545 RepID=A0A7C8IV38_9PEZI|nr:hypothetical protein GQX73_g4862 [Xylaria multiplex]
MHKAQRKYDTQYNVVNTRVTEIRALSLQKEELIHEVATVNHPYEVSLATLKRHVQRLAESGRPGGNGEFEKNARKGLEIEKKKCEEAEARIKARIKAVVKNIEKAQKSEQRERKKLDELHGKLAEAKTQTIPPKFLIEYFYPPTISIFTLATSTLILLAGLRSSAMPSTTVTSTMRELAWNVEFTVGQEEDPSPFAGIYQVPGSELVTFRNVCDELRLCFEFPNNIAREESSVNSGNENNNNNNKQSSIDNDDPLASLAFGLTRPLNLQQVQGLSFVTGNLLDKPVPTLPLQQDLKQRNVLIYHLVSHKNCALPANSPLDTQLEKGCAQELSEPVRRFNPRYLQPNKTLCDPALEHMPLRGRGQPCSPTNRPAPGSPRKQSLDNINDTEFDNMLAPQDIDYNEAKRYSTEFRSSCLTRGTCCVVSGEGEATFSPKGDFLLKSDPRDPGRTGSPSKRPWLVPPNQNQAGAVSGPDNLEEADAALRTNEAEYKGRRLEECQEDMGDMQDSYMTPTNSREFLEGVNRRLQRFKDRQHARGILE